MDKPLFIYNNKETEINCNPKTQMNSICNEFCQKENISYNLVYFLYNHAKLDLSLRYEQLKKSPFKKYKVIFVFDNKKQQSNQSSVYYYTIQSKLLCCPKCNKSLNIIISNSNYKYICITNDKFDKFEDPKSDLILKECIFCSDNQNMYFCELCKFFVCSGCISKHKLLDNIRNYHYKKIHGIEDDNNSINIQYNVFDPYGTITIVYEQKELFPTKIFGSYFVNTNKDKCKILYQGIFFDLSEYFSQQTPYELLTIQLVGTINISDMSNMFEEASLVGLPDFLNWNPINITDLSYMFSGCSLLEYLPDISNWNTMNVTSLCYMFSGCSSLKALPDISKWDTKNVTDMSYLFSCCSSLISLPDISKWNTKKVTNLSGIFSECKNISSMPDISKWNTDNLTNISAMFLSCSSLTNLPDLSKWNMEKVKNKTYLFKNCYSLAYLPDLSKCSLNYDKPSSNFVNAISLINYS